MNGDLVAVFAFDGDGFFAFLQRYPGGVLQDEFGVVGLGFFLVEVEVVYGIDGETPSEAVVVAEYGIGNAGEEVSVEFEARVVHIGFVPDGGLGEMDMGVIGEDGVAGGAARGRQHPGVGAGPEGQACFFEGIAYGVEESFFACRHALLGGGQYGFFPVFGVFGSEFGAYFGESRIGMHGIGEAQGHVIYNGIDIFEIELRFGDADEGELRRSGAFVYEGVDAVEVALGELQPFLVLC